MLCLKHGTPENTPCGARHEISFDVRRVNSKFSQIIFLGRQVNWTLIKHFKCKSLKYFTRNNVQLQPRVDTIGSF